MSHERGGFSDDVSEVLQSVDKSIVLKPINCCDSHDKMCIFLQTVPCLLNDAFKEGMEMLDCISKTRRANLQLPLSDVKKIAAASLELKKDCAFKDFVCINL
jgi:hypothetical protein